MTLTWHHTAWDFKAAPPALALLPLAGVEPHGPHLPVGGDAILMGDIARQVAEALDEPTFLLPTWPIGTAQHHAGQPGVLSLGFDTLWAVVRDVVLSLHQRGLSRIVVLNNHGSAFTTTARPFGNFIVKTAVRQLNYEHPGLTVIWVQPFAAGRDALAELFPSATQEVHAGAVETSMLMHLAPELIDERPDDHVPSADPIVLDSVPFAKVAPTGVWGRPREASAEKGELALRAVVDATTDYIRRTFEQLDRIKSRSAERLERR